MGEELVYKMLRMSAQKPVQDVQAAGFVAVFGVEGVVSSQLEVHLASQEVLYNYYNMLYCTLPI